MDAKGSRLSLDIDVVPSVAEVISSLFTSIPADRHATLAGFLVALLKLFRDLNFVYLEINPLVMSADGRIMPLDMAAKIDETALFLNHIQWGALEFPAPFGRAEFAEESFIKKLDQSSGSSLKLTILNEFGRVWTMVCNDALVVRVGACT